VVNQHRLQHRELGAFSAVGLEFALFEELQRGQCGFA